MIQEARYDEMSAEEVRGIETALQEAARNAWRRGRFGTAEALEAELDHLRVTMTKRSRSGVIGSDEGTTT